MSIGSLPIDRITHVYELTGEHRLINALEQTGSEVAVNAQGDIDHVSSDRVNVLHFFSASPRLRVNIQSSFASASISSIVMTLVTFASGAMRLTIDRQHLAAELDEFLDAGRGHVGDAFAPADHAGDLLDELVADRVGIGLRLRR